MANPLFPDDLSHFLLFEHHALEEVLALPAFSGHSQETCGLFLDAAKRVAREVLFPAYEMMDREPPVFDPPTLRLHPRMRELYAHVVELGMLSATRPESVGGAQLPTLVGAFAAAHLMAGNLSVYALTGLTLGAARLIESFGSDDLKQRFMDKMYRGEWSGTMALTEPQAGSSLADVETKAIPSKDGSYRISGTKVFISGGEQDLTRNIVHLTLARIEGAPAGIGGVSLFAVPKLREGKNGEFVPNDVVCSSVFKKVGWKALPSVQLSYGDNGDCHGWLVGEAHRGIKHMFQMMNEARLMVGLHGIATASVAFEQSRIYAQDRPQGRPVGVKDPASKQVPITQHADVRRMLLRQQAIVEAGFGLLLRTARLTDFAEQGASEDLRRESHLLLDLLIPVAKTFPAEYGFESNTLAVQIHGGYGYTSEYLPESWWRDQKLNSIHEGTSGIQALDLLGRKVVAAQGEAMRLFIAEVGKTCDAAAAIDAELGEHATALRKVIEDLATTTMAVAGRGLSGDLEGMLAHASDYMDAFAVTCAAWELLSQTVSARRKAKPESFQATRRRVCAYWFATDLPYVPVTLARVRSGERSFRDADFVG